MFVSYIPTPCYVLFQITIVDVSTYFKGDDIRAAVLVLDTRFTICSEVGIQIKRSLDVGTKTVMNPSQSAFILRANAWMSRRQAW